MGNTQVPIQQPVTPSSSTHQSHIFPMILGGLALLGVGFAGGYFIANTSKQLPTPSTIQSTPTEIPSHNTSTDSNLVLYTHPKNIYSLKYPSSWIEDSEKLIADYTNFVIRTPDYELTNPDGLSSLAKGAEIQVIAYNTKAMTVEELLERDALIAKNKITTKVDSQSAIQYDISYEGANTTRTIFIKNGIEFAITFRYSDITAKEYYMESYKNLLTSFKAK